jgi:hypothetical protein
MNAPLWVLPLAPAPLLHYKQFGRLFLWHPQPGDIMTLCPIALLATCNKCLAVGFCPLKEVLGDYKAESKDGEAAKPAATDKPPS